MCTVLPYIRLLRPADWIKNIFVFAALAFGNKIRDPNAIVLSILAFATFCFVSSAGYIFNDMLDRQRDRLHPAKKNRPLASGTVSLGAASSMMVLLILLSAVICYKFLSPQFAIATGTYLFLTVTYSLALKHRMILDVIIIAILFVLRALSGAVAIDVPVSPWLLVCTFMLCLFIGFGKRRCEIASLADADAMLQHRPTLVRYTPDLLNHLLSTSGGVAIVTFLLYTLDTSWPSPFGEQRHNLIYTLPLVVYGIYRYAMLIESGKAVGPTELIIKDTPFLMTVVLWTASAIAILYTGSGLGYLVPPG